MKLFKWMLSTSHQYKKYLNYESQNLDKEKIRLSRARAASSHLLLTLSVTCLPLKHENKWERSTFLNALTSKGYVKVAGGQVMLLLFHSYKCMLEV